MKAVLTKEDVSGAMKQLADQGKKVTLNSLHAALGQRGSMTTLVRLKAEIEGEAQAVTDSAEGLKTFREVWSLAIDEGRKQQEATIIQLHSDCLALASENDRLEGLATAAENRAAQLLDAKAAAEAERLSVRSQQETALAKANSELIQAAGQARDALARLAETQAVHAQEMRSSTEKLEAEQRNRHQLELELVHTKALLEATNKRNPRRSELHQPAGKSI